MGIDKSWFRMKSIEPTEETTMQSHQNYVVTTMGADEYESKYGRPKRKGNHAVKVAREMEPGTAIIVEHGGLSCKIAKNGQRSCSILAALTTENGFNKAHGVGRHYYSNHLEDGTIGIVLYADGK